ncbi:MAG: FAD/NAD(P)-binding protein [Planctomycetaceae bacterium]|nr:FAD/NAD(P)-binding protein [Planctomycetaceae bacterium]
MVVELSAVKSVSPWQTHSVRIVSVKAEIPGVMTYRLKFVDQAVGNSFTVEPGQFNMLYLPGYGESAISVSGYDPENNELLHTVRAAGNVTRALSRLVVGDELGLRGPFGQGWPMETARDGHLVLIAGGLGFAPICSAIETAVQQSSRYRRISILAGARSPDQLLYGQQYNLWKAAGAELRLTVDRATSQWSGNVGVVPLLVNRIEISDPATTTVMMCGPEMMMWYTAKAATERNIPAENIWLSMERNMNCAIGHCGHCQFGPAFICKDGPVLRYDKIASYLKIKGL